MDTTLSDSSKRRGRRGSPNHPIAFRRQLGEAADRPGISVAALAREHGINANLLFNWRKQYRDGLLGEPTFVPAVVGNAGLPASSPPVASGPVRPSRSLAAVVEIEVNGAKVKISGAIDEGLLRSVIASLR